MRFRPWALALALLITTPSAFGDSPELLNIYTVIEHSFAENDVHSQTAFVEQIQGLNQAIRRHRLGSAELRNLKYSLGYWREIIARRTILQLSQGMEDEDVAVGILLLSKLKPSLDKAGLQILRAVAEKDPRLKLTIGLLMADFGIRGEVQPILLSWGDQRALQRLGPPPIDKIQPFLGSSLKGLDWVDGIAKHMAPMTPAELNRFEFLSRHSVRFWGQEIRTGDVFLYDLATPTDGPLTAFSMEPAAFTHAGIFVIFNREDRLVPAILEMHKRGNRVIPLSNLEGHVYYAESYRPRFATERWQDNLTGLIEHLQTGPRVAIDFQARPLNEAFEFATDGEQRCTTCVGLTEMLFTRASDGTTPIRFERTELPEGAKQNLLQLGLPRIENLPLPVNIARHPEMQLVGIFDNGKLAENFARELFIGDIYSPHSAGHTMAHRRLELAKLQATRYGELMSSPEDRSHPSIPTDAAAFFLNTQAAMEAQVRKMAVACRASLRQLGENPLRFESLQSTPRIQRALEKGFGASGISRWYFP